VAVGPADKEAEIRTRWYGTTVPALRELQAWLHELGCTSVAMESTGSYWIPVKNILEEDCQITPVCARKHRPRKGDKSDFRDAINLAVHHRQGLLLAERYERGSVLMTSNLAFSKWEGIFKDAMMTAAAIDRLVHHSVIIELNIPSYREEEAKKKQQTEGQAEQG
jgi:hypothetical protein